jgi:cupin 2 domain-containing protein
MNLYDYSLPLSGESFTPLLEKEKVKILRIVSSETPDNILYNQEEDEWVVLLEGSATLEMADRRIELKRGDTLFIPARTPHRVLRTEAGTLWIAVHIGKFLSTT